MQSESKIFINFCPTGMIPTKATTPFVPITPSEIIEQTHEAYELGISIAHLHARLDNEEPTHKAEVYHQIVEGLRQHCPDLILCLSTSGRNVSDFEKRSEVIELRPDMCSLTLSSLNFMQGASVNSPQTIVALLEKMLAYGVHPELECFDLGMVNYGRYLQQRFQLEGPCYWNVILGNIAGAQPSFSQMGALLEAIPAGDYVSLGGVGRHQLECNALAIAKGLGVRVGLEDNLWWDAERTQLASNLQLVKRIHQLMEIQGKRLLTSREMGLYNRSRVAVAR
ncbi:MAG: 3-keto-5-aminohexanoate cleavage protein [Candidatus Sericytochromatia bacterium]